MENRFHKESHGGGGFFLGVVVGVLVTLLFTTKKGKRMLRMFTDEGLEKVTSIEEFIKTVKNIPDEYDEYEQDPGQTDYVKQESMRPRSSVQPPYTPDPEVTNGVSHSYHGHSAGRRFFRGIPKRA